MPIKFKTDLGTIKIDDNVIATIAGLSAMESYGIVGMASKNAADGFFELLKWDHFTKGISVVSKEEKLNIDLHIIVEYGVQISVVSKNIKDIVKQRSILSAYIFCEKANDLISWSQKSFDLTIIDRYYESALCYHYLRGELSKELCEIYSQLIKTDLSVFLDISPDKCIERLARRSTLSPYETKEYLEQAHYFYHTKFKSFWKIDASLSPDEISHQIYSKIIKAYFKGHL